MERRETKYGIIYILKRVFQNNITEREREKKTFGEILERTKLKRQKQHCHIGQKCFTVIVLTSNS